MLLMNDERRYGAVAKSLHWIAAALFVALFVLGWTMTELPLCAEKGISAVIGSVFSSGITATGGGSDAVYGYKPPPADVLTKLNGIEAVCARHGVPMRAAALQFPLFHPVVASIIPGAMAPEHVMENAALMEHAIPSDFWAELKSERLMHPDAPTG